MATWMQLIALAVLRASTASAFDYDGCTSIIVSSGATVDGSALTSHSNDCVDCDWRMVHVPARDHEEGALRRILDTKRSAYPRVVDPERSPQYQPGAGINSSTLMGYIPEARHTYALWEATYSLMNEKGLTMGESTCAAHLVGNRTAKVYTTPEVHSYKDGALFTIGGLMSIALERCETARCAVQTMGDLGAKYGFYGEDPGKPGAGEAVTVADASGETWVFHMAGGLPEYDGAPFSGQRGAVWAAQRVPQGHVAVVANNFIIREVKAEDTENFMVHRGLFELTKEAGLWDGTGKFDFLKVMAPDMRSFSYTPGLDPIPMYTTLRIWWVFSQAAPSLDIPVTDSAWSYPFSVPVDRKVSLLEVMDWFRTHYEGTEYDMRLGVLAGPFQSPNRAEGGPGQAMVQGQSARSTSIMRTSYTQVGQTGVAQPKLWYAPDASASSVFVPFYASVLAEADGQFDVKAFGEGSAKDFDFSAEVKPAWWAFDFVANWMEMSYYNMSETYVTPKVKKLQKEVADAVGAAEQAAAQKPSSQAAAALLAAEQTRLQRHVTDEWWNFAAMLLVRYNDYFFNFGEYTPDQVNQIGYPAFWLEMVGYDSEFFFPHWVQPSQTIPALLPAREQVLALAAKHGPKPEEVEDLAAVRATAAVWPACAAAAAALGMLASGMIGYRLGRGAVAKEDMQCDYIQVLG